jgi:hypothetical protein
MCFVEHNDRKAAERIRGLTRHWLETGTPIAFDYETNCLKPDSRDARILCASLSDGTLSYAFPWTGVTAEAMRVFLTSGIPKIGANLRFENRWTMTKLGVEVENWRDDTLLGAHWKDCRRHICSVKFQAFVLLGMEDYDSHLHPYMTGKGGNGINRLCEVEPKVLMKYCAMDSLLEWLISQVQMEGY